MQDNQQNPNNSGTPSDWKFLSDIQKAQVLLGSSRLPDTAAFIETYTSFEEPTIEPEEEIKLQGIRGRLNMNIIMRETFGKDLNL